MIIAVSRPRPVHCYSQDRQPSAISQRVRRNFSKASVCYDQLATLQQAIGLKFLKSIKDQKPESILDIGMGTGWLTERLSVQFPEAAMVGMDFSSGMIDVARNKKYRFKIIQADGRALPFKDGVFDLIVSNLTYQWIDDLPCAFRQAYKTLKDGGVFYLSSFGPKTLRELFFSIGKSLDGSKKKEAVFHFRLPGKEDLANAILQTGFHDFRVTSEIAKVYFPDCFALVRWLKNIGANRLQSKPYFGKQLFLKTNEFYTRHFTDQGSIYATFEVVWVKAKKSSAPKLLGQPQKLIHVEN